MLDVRGTVDGSHAGWCCVAAMATTGIKDELRTVLIRRSSGSMPVRRELNASKMEDGVPAIMMIGDGREVMEVGELRGGRKPGTRQKSIAILFHLAVTTKRHP